MRFLIIYAVILAVSSTVASGQSYEDKRCKCVCPSIKSVINNTQDKVMYIQAPNRDGFAFILPKIKL